MQKSSKKPFSNLHMKRSQRSNENALFPVTKYHICDHNQIVGWNALQLWSGMMNSVFFLKEVQPVVRTIRTRPTVSTRSQSPSTHHHHHHCCFLSSHSHHDTISPCWDFVCNDCGGNLSVTKSHRWAKTAWLPPNWIFIIEWLGGGGGQVGMATRAGTLQLNNQLIGCLK